MNEISVFNFHGNEVRVVKDDNGEPWFVAKDICDVLELTNPTAAIAALDEDERSKFFLGRQGNTNIINESGLYALVIRSNKPNARKFRKWITSEVLPSIRKHGGYIASNGTESVEELYMRAMESLHAALERQKAITAEQTKQLEKQAPDVEYCNTVLAAKNLHTVNSIATHLGTTAVRLNRLLLIHGYIYKKGGIYYPSASIRDKGYCDFHVVPYVKGNGEIATREHLKWTEEGRRFVINFYHTVMG